MVKITEDIIFHTGQYINSYITALCCVLFNPKNCLTELYQLSGTMDFLHSFSVMCLFKERVPRKICLTKASSSSLDGIYVIVIESENMRTQYQKERITYNE